MAVKKQAVKLSEKWQGESFQCHKKFIGGRMFYLSKDARQAEREAMALVTTWQRLQASSSGWTEDAITEALQLAGAKKTVSKKVAGSQYLHAAIDDYLSEYRPRVSSGRYIRHACAMNDYKRQQADVPLRMVTPARLAATVAHYRARPTTAHGGPMAVASVQTTLKAIVALLDWCDLSGRWEAPRRFEKMFRVNYKALRTPLEVKMEGNGVDTFTIAELTTLWQAATSRQRLYIAIALNTGETSKGIADLLKADVVESGAKDNRKVTIDRHRGKTGVHGVYPLWAETAALLAENLNTDETEALAFKTMDGNPLVWFNDCVRVDSIAKTWANLLTKCPKVRRLGFSYLRKTGASMIRELTGSLEVAQTYLSHRGQSIAEKHYLALSFERLADALSSMRSQLSPMFASDNVKSVAASGSVAA